MVAKGVDEIAGSSFKRLKTALRGNIWRGALHIGKVDSPRWDSIGGRFHQSEGVKSTINSGNVIPTHPLFVTC